VKDQLVTFTRAMPRLLLIAGLATATYAAPASAQSGLGQVASEGATCAVGWSNPRVGGSRLDSSVCVATGSNAREVYRRHGNEACRAGYNTGTSWCEKAPVQTIHSSNATPLEKASKGDRCPTGWYTDNGGLQCITKVTSPTSARAKNGRPCRANEVEEWGVWCTSNYEGMPAETMRSWALRDWNSIYGYNRGVPTVNVGQEITEAVIKITPVHAKVYGNTMVTDPVVGGSNTSANTGANAATPTPSCTNGAAQGAAVGGAIAGSTGRALGGMLGGMARRSQSGC
jgi:hypothetical protein